MKGFRAPHNSHTDPLFKATEILKISDLISLSVYRLFHKAQEAIGEVCLTVISGPYTSEYTRVGGRTRAPSRGRFTGSTTSPLASLWLVKVPSRGRYTSSTTGPRPILYDSWRCPLVAGTRVTSQVVTFNKPVLALYYMELYKYDAMQEQN